ncbi:Mediator of DNA damage checkpoint protein 1 [Talaromyces islandicus]|uniref:Mediator of DNA damage checkpoint protein 1 n=1 Tax=Talaromyces islandicus TaxID=28573 RepID=A0A0U1LWR6_TALIS|nr:Mediator of DNA damage checkpoint protein 1 [Talaromyces islandicus]
MAANTMHSGKQWYCQPELVANLPACYTAAIIDIKANWDALLIEDLLVLWPASSHSINPSSTTFNRDMTILTPTEEMRLLRADPPLPSHLLRLVCLRTPPDSTSTVYESVAISPLWTTLPKDTGTMVGLPVVIAVAVGCSAFLIVGAILGVVVWWRMRQDRLFLAMAHARQTVTHQGPVGSSFVTESPIESPLPTHPYPYMRCDYVPIGSQETIQPWASHTKKSPLPTLKKEKSKSIRRSISKSLSKSLSIGKNNKKTSQPEQMPVSPLDETFLPPFPNAKEKEPKSAIAGFSELPTEITPRNTPERERDDVIPLEMLNNRPSSTAWPLLQQDRISTVSAGQATTIYDRYPSRLRGGSITAQTAGTVPEMPMPPPPVGLAQPYQLSHEDSLMGMSSLSLETANSSILDEGLGRSMSVGGENNNSPSLPPCPTFTPFSPYDIVIGGSVARNCASQRRSQSQRLSSSTARLTYMSAESSKGDLDDRTPPRRSLTTREASPQPSGWATSSELPRRSETVLSSSSAGRPGSRPVSSTSVSSPGARYSATGQGMYSRQEFGTQSNRQERYSMYETSQAKEENNAAFSKSVGDRPQSIQTQSPMATRDSPGRAPLPSAMKSAQSMRKGHRRQNCVRISIHPPITFNGPAFSPMLEEPEEVLDLEKDLGVPKSQPQSTQLSVGRTGSKYQPKHARHRSTGSISEEPAILADSLGTNSRIPRPSSSKKRPHSRTSSADDVFMSENRVIIPNRGPGPVAEEERRSLSSTPSPEKHEPLWSLPHSDVFVGCSPILPTNASTGSPRRSAPKGPRIQPIKSQRNTAPSLSTTQPIANGVYTFTAGASSPDGSPTPKVGRSHTLAASPTKDVRKSITLLRRMNSEAWDDESKQYRRMGRNASLTNPRVNKFSTSPQSNRNSWMSNDSLTIWEDASEDDISTPPPVRQKSHPFKLLERIDSEGTAEESMSNVDSQRQQTIRQVPPSSSIVTFGDNEHRVKTNGHNGDDELVHKPAERASVVSTPNTKATRYGIMSLTPGSLYDGDGFLKE